MTILWSLRISFIGNSKKLIKLRNWQKEQEDQEIKMIHLCLEENKKITTIKIKMKMMMMNTSHLKSKRHCLMKWKIKLTKKNYKHCKCINYYKKKKRSEKANLSNHLKQWFLIPTKVIQRFSVEHRIRLMKIIINYQVISTFRITICKASLHQQINLRLMMLLLLVNLNKKKREKLK